MVEVIDKRTGMKRRMTRAYADMLTKLGRVRPLEAVAAKTRDMKAEKAGSADKKSTKKKPTKKRAYKRRDMQAEE